MINRDGVHSRDYESILGLGLLHKHATPSSHFLHPSHHRDITFITKQITSFQQWLYLNYLPKNVLCAKEPRLVFVSSAAGRESAKQRLNGPQRQLPRCHRDPSLHHRNQVYLRASYGKVELVLSTLTRIIGVTTLTAPCSPVRVPVPSTQSLHPAPSAPLTLALRTASITAALLGTRVHQ